MLNKRISTIVLSAIICSVPISSLAVSNENSDKLIDLKKESVTINQEINNEEVTMEMKLNEEGNVIVETSSDKESHTAIVNPNTLEMTLDGKPIELWLEVDGEKIDENQLKNLMPKSESVVKNNARSSWTPVYQSTYKLHYSDMVTSLLGVVTVVGGAVAAASLMGIAISTASIKSQVLAWASVVAIPGQFVPNALKGYIQYSLYRTKGKVTMPTQGTKYAWRYQNVRAIYTLKGKKFDKQLKSIGNWWT